MKKIFLLICFLQLVSTSSFAWEGEDQETGEAVEIGSGELVRTGNNIEFFDNSDMSYHSGDIISITRSGSNVELEINDNDTGNTRTLEMHD